MLRRFKAHNVLAGVCFLCMLVSRTQADVVFSQSPDYMLGYWSDIPGQQIADNFTLTSPATIGRVDWWGADYGGVIPDNFTIRFFNDVAGSPDTNPFATPVFTNLTKTYTGNNNAWGGQDGGKVYFYTADLVTPVALPGGTQFHLSILNGDTNNWIWEDTDRSNVASYRWGDGTAWNTGNVGDRAFQLETHANVVPESGSLALLTGGLLVPGVAFLYRRRKTAL